MMGRLFLRALFCASVISCCVPMFFGGCASPAPSVDKEPTREVFLTDYAAAAFEAGGGYRAWRAVSALELDCVVTFYQANGSSFLTEQKYTIQPWSDLIEVVEKVPSGKITRRLSRGSFTSTGKRTAPAAMPAEMNERDFLEAVLDITSAPVRLVSQRFWFTRAASPERIQGLWYYPIERVPYEAADGPALDGCKAFFYQHVPQNAQRIDIIWYPDCHAQSQSKAGILVKGYDYGAAAEAGVLIPRTIEIFSTDWTGISLKRLAKIAVIGIRNF